MSRATQTPRSQTGHSDTVSEGIRVTVGAVPRPDDSHPEIGKWIYLYRVVLRNEGEVPVRLLTRHWTIRNADNHAREVHGQGVIGQNPELAPGETFTYMSGCSLDTEWGTMEGWFRFRRVGGGVLRARIGRFFLAPTVAPLPEMREESASQP